MAAHSWKTDNFTYHDSTISRDGVNICISKPLFHGLHNLELKSDFNEEVYQTSYDHDSASKMWKKG